MGTFLSSERSARVQDMLFEHAAEGLVVVDGSGRIVMHNPRMRALFGYGRTDLEGQPIEVLLPDQLRGSHKRSRVGYQKTPTHRPMGRGMDLVGRRKDGSTFPVR